MPNHNQHRPTLKTIAELTGLSLSTVSLSLRDGSKLRQSTREKVAKAAKQIGYVPNRAGVRLRTGRTNVLALILSADENSTDFTRLLIQGIGAQLRHTAFHLNVIPEIDPDDRVAAVRYVLENRVADGVILTHTSARDPRVQLLMDANFPFVSHGRTEFYTPHPYHDFHAERFVELAIQRLVQKGRRRVVLAAVDNGTTYYAIAVNYFRRLIAETGLFGEIAEDIATLKSSKEARAFGQLLATRSERYDAILCNNELTAISIVGGMSDKGLELGTDYDLICRQTTEILPLLYPGLDTVTEDLSVAGQELARLLMASIEGEDADSLQSMHEPVSHWRSDLADS